VGEQSILHIDFVTFDLAPSIEDRCRVGFLAKEPNWLCCFFQYRPVPSVMPQSLEMRRSDLERPERANASKNLHFLRVVASLPARGSGDGVRKGLDRVGGAIIVEKVGCLHLVSSRIYDFDVFGPCVNNPVTHCWQRRLC
jgi:hypothetical protein